MIKGPYGLQSPGKEKENILSPSAHTITFPQQSGMALFQVLSVIVIDLNGLTIDLTLVLSEQSVLKNVVEQSANALQNGIK